MHFCTASFLIKINSMNSKITLMKELNVFERYVNDGSPTGLTFSNSSSDCTSPFLGTPSIVLPIVWIDVEKVLLIGETSFFAPQIDGMIAVPVHPDCWKWVEINLRVNRDNTSCVLVEPTSSPRTLLYVENDNIIYIKLHYPMALGRFSSDLTGEKITIPLKISEFLSRAENLLPEINFLPEIGGLETEIFVNAPRGNKTGVVYRSSTPVQNIKLERMFPFFSLFAKNCYPVLEDVLINMLIRDIDNKAEFIIKNIIDPLLASFWAFVTQYGLWPEAHAQNIILGISENGEFHIIWRDLQGFYRETNIELPINIHLGDAQYHLLPKDPLELIKKRSHLYDGYLGLYCLEPLLSVMDAKTRKTVKSFIVEKTRAQLSSSGINFPEGKWFAMPAQAPRPGEWLELQEYSNPIYR